MARRARSSRRGQGIKWAQVMVGVVGRVIVLSMILAMLPIGR